MGGRSSSPEEQGDAYKASEGSAGESSASAINGKANGKAKAKAKAKVKAKAKGEPREESSVPMTTTWEDVVSKGLGVAEGAKHQGTSRVQLCGAGGGAEAGAGADREVIVSCVVKGVRKDQDRFICLPQLLPAPGVLFAGVFDGHGSDGDYIAEAVSVNLPKRVRELLLEADAEAGLGSDKTKAALVEAFAGMQKSLDEEYEVTVVEPSMRVKLQLEEQHKTPLGQLTLPLGSGTTATTFIVDAGQLHVGYVGDSRAVLCRPGAKAGSVTVEDITSDQNVASASEEELARLAEAGGTIFGRHVAGDYIDGMLQLTRSLGDVPLHRQGLVLHEPVVRSVDLDGSALFVIAASDGLWDYFASQEACEFVHGHVAAAANAKDGASAEELLLHATKTLETEVASRASAKGRQSDDICVMLMVFDQWW